MFSPIVSVLALAMAAHPTPVGDLSAWEDALGQPAPVVAGCRAAALDATLLIDCAGAALLVDPVPGSTMVDIMDAQVAPFFHAGLPIEDPVFVPCFVGGEPAECLSLTIDMGMPRARMHMLSGEAPDGSHVALCMIRPTAPIDPCVGIIEE